MSVHDIGLMLDEAKKGDKRALSKLISAVESGGAAARQVEAATSVSTARARVIGITGPPGSGKSTLTKRLIELLRQRGKSVGVIAVDPTSPFTGGAILGDRVRMAGDPDTGLYIRSMGSRGAMGGLSAAARGAVDVLNACGFDEIIIESVGTGQNDVEIVNHADIILLLAVPGLGDDIQSIKAGLLEIGDVFAVNKCDLPGGDMVSAELQSSLSMAQGRHGVQPLVVMVSAMTGEGMPELMVALDSQFEALEKSGELALRRILRVSGGRLPARNAFGKGTGMNCLNIDHIGVAVKDLEQAAEFYEKVLGIKRSGVEEVAEQQVKVMFLPCGDCEVELLESTAEGSAVDRFLSKNGEGVQHIAICVEDIDASLAELKEKGVRLIDETPRYGAGGARIAFIHPKATNGVLVELCERT